MNQAALNSGSYEPDPGTLAIHVLCEMTTRQRRGERAQLDDLASAVGVRRADVRGVVSLLHRQGYVDAVRMRVTLAGFAIGLSLGERELGPVLRPVVHAEAVSRAA